MTLTTNGGEVPRAKYCPVLESLARAPRETINSLVAVECTEAVINKQSSAWARESICKESQLEGLGSGLVSRVWVERVGKLVHVA